MTDKELLYLEDAINHEQLFVAFCEEASNAVKGEHRDFFNRLKQEHQDIFNNLKELIC